MAAQIVNSLNASQKAAVTATAKTVAILAGPGSGKTHTLTSRTAWLLHHEGYQPWNVLVATFTNKAAKEMEERIGKLVGDDIAQKLILGTFHSIAGRYLRRYGHLIGIPKDFGIADSGDSLSIIKRIIKRHNMTIEPTAARNRVSSRKAKGAEWNTGNRTKSVEVQECDTCYTEYEASLKRSNLLDFDDLLLRCVELLRAHPSCVSNIEAVLIDEFQDTNLVQFDLMRLFASQRKRVTIVGDPDQSIYGWRSAETKNFKRMTAQYPDTITIPLEENYRSSAAILLAALEVIRQDESRIDKSLLPTHTVGTQPVLRKLATAHAEAQWIVSEIQRCLLLTGNLMDYNDIAILMRSASLSRIIESALSKVGIPYRMVGGARFYDRVEVKLILDYMRVINQPDNNDAFARIVNVPPRRIGDSTIKSLLEEADMSRTTLWALALDIVQGNITAKTKLAKQTEQGLSSFINIILTARKKIADESLSITELIELVTRKISFVEYLAKQYPEEEEQASRMANVHELNALAADFAAQVASFGDEDALPDIEGVEQESVSQPLSMFLANVALASSADPKGSEEVSVPQPQITISTIHAAKGLEWPVVFVPAAYQGSIPHSRAEDDDEERRLLYVAMTRAKALLYLSYPLKNSQQEQTTLSPFLTPKTLKSYVCSKGPSFLSNVTGSIVDILRRPHPTIFDRTAIENLVTAEDNGFAIDEEGTENPEKNHDEWGGHHYSMGQTVAKRRRIESDNVTKSTITNSWTPSYTTTMASAATFTASNIPKSGFISAGSHLQTLSEQSVHCVSESQQSKTASRKQSTVNRVAEAPSAMVQVTATKRPAGQHSLFDFMKRPVSLSIENAFPQPAAPIHRNDFRAPRSQAAKVHNNSSRPSNSQASLPVPIAQTSGILPTLADHKISTASLPRPLPSKRWQQEDDVDITSNSYVFLSSSPQAAASLVHDAEQVPIEPLVLAPVIGTKQPTKPSKPILSFHTTTVQRMNTLGGPPPPRRQLGVRRTMASWNDRKNK